MQMRFEIIIDYTEYEIEKRQTYNHWCKSFEEMFYVLSIEINKIVYHNGDINSVHIEHEMSVNEEEEQ